MLICGPSGCVKTNTLMHMLHQLLFYDKIYLFCKSLQQPKYQELLKTFQPISKEAGYQVIETGNDEIPSLDELNDDNQKIVVFDDFVCEKKQKPALTVGGAKSIYLPLNGSRGMESSLNMSNNTIRNLKMPANDPSGGNLPDDCALNFKYFHSQRGHLERQINEVESDAFSKDGSDPMGGNLHVDMNNHEIINIKEPQSSNSHYAATVNFVNKTVSDNNTTINNMIDSKVAEVETLNIKASKRENVLSFVMDDDLFKEDDDDITKVGKVEKDFYDINRATYEFTTDYDSKIGYYSTRLTIDLKALDIGIYISF